MKTPDSLGLNLWARGYRVLFHSGETNRCPGCGKSQWLVGRVTAECAVWGTALPLAEAELGGFNPNMQRAVALRLVARTGRAPVDKRAGERADGEGRVLSLHIDGSVHPFALQNISAGGAMGQAAIDPAGAGSLAVELEDGTLMPAEIKWTDGAVAGMAFVRRHG